MISVTRDSPINLLFYWNKPVKDRLGRSVQNHHFIAVIRPPECVSLSSKSDKNWVLGKSSRFIANIHSVEIVQIPIAFQHSKIHCLRPAVSSLGVCPTPAR
jgi:hypothetical protein